MTRKIVSDMIVTKKSIRQIPISTIKRQRVEPEDFGNDHDDAGESLNVIRTGRGPNWRRKSLNPKFAIWFIAVICLLALFFGISIIFSSATVIVTPKTEKIVFNNDLYTAKADSPGVTNDLSFEVLTVKQTVGEIVEATEDKQVSLKATGKIIIYNNYSTATQRLINNTRFEANNGKIYRLSNSVVVPGLKKSGDKTIPGSIEVTVFADQAGESFNLKLSDLAGDFKIPGFKGDPRYQGFYGRLKTDISGGLVGTQRIVASDLRKTTEDTIKVKLKEQLLKELYAVKPESYLIFADGYSIDYSNLADTAVDNSKVKINIEGNLNAVVFNNLKLSKYIASKKINGFAGLATELIPTDSLVTTFKAPDTTGLWKNKTLEIKFSGEATIKWLYDSEMIKKDLAGKSGSEAKNIIAKYKDSILSIKVIFRPVWTRYFPDNLDKIKIKEEI